MMLQADAPAPVWGWADPGETVSATFAGQTQTAQVDDQSEWHVTFAPLNPGTNGPLTLNGKTEPTACPQDSADCGAGAAALNNCRDARRAPCSGDLFGKPALIAGVVKLDVR